MGTVYGWLEVADAMLRAKDLQAAHDAFEMARRAAFAKGDSFRADEIAGEMAEVRLTARARGVPVV
jgi:hypothetical protein